MSESFDNTYYALKLQIAKFNFLVVVLMSPRVKRLKDLQPKQSIIHFS